MSECNFLFSRPRTGHTLAHPHPTGGWKPPSLARWEACRHTCGGRHLCLPVSAASSRVIRWLWRGCQVAPISDPALRILSQRLLTSAPTERGRRFQPKTPSLVTSAPTRMGQIKKPRIAPGLFESKTTYLRRRKSNSERLPKPAKASVLGSGIGFMVIPLVTPLPAANMLTPGPPVGPKRAVPTGL